MRPLSVTAFSKERGVSRARVYQWLEDGRISKLGDGSIDADDAHSKLGERLDQAKGVRRDGNITSSAPQLPAMETEKPAAPEQPRGGDAGYWADKAREQKAVAQLAEMKALREAGALTSSAAVRKEATETARRLRNVMLAIPDKIAPVLDPGNPGRAHKLLTDEITKALREFRAEREQRAAAAAGVDEREPALL